MPFEISLDGKMYRTDSLTIDEAERLEAECDKTWLELNPIRSAKEFRAIVRVLLGRDHAPDDVDRFLAACTIGKAMRAVNWVDDDLPAVFENGLPDPKVGGGRSTTTSSSSPDPPTNGPPTSPADNGSATSSSSSPRSTEVT